MVEEKCCGCLSLYAAAGVGILWALAKAIFGMFINVCLIELMSGNTMFNPFRQYVDVESMEDFDIIGGIVLAGFGLNAMWFTFGILASVGNIIKLHGSLSPWLCLTYLTTFSEFGVSVYFAFKFSDAYYREPEFYQNGSPTIKMTYLTLLSVYSGGGFMLFLNLYFAQVVEKRKMMIDKDYKAKNLLTDEPPSYEELHPEIFRTTKGSGTSWTTSCENLKSMGNVQQLNTAYKVTNVDTSDSDCEPLLLDDFCKDY